MPAPAIDDLQHWRDSASEIRALVEDVKDEASKQKMLQIADDYERLAKRAEERGSARHF